MPRFTRPERSNRVESVQEIWRKIDWDDESIATAIARRSASVDHYIAQQNAAALSGAADQLQSSLTDAAVIARWNSQSNANELLRKAFAGTYWYVELTLNVRRAQRIGDMIREDGLIDLLHWQGLSLACGSTWFAEWVAGYLFNIFFSGGAAKNNFHLDRPDQPACLFMQTLQYALVKKQWPNAADIAQVGGAYAPLLAQAGNPVGFRAALMDYCDYRVAQCFGYDGIDATKRRRPSQIESVLDMAGWARPFPVELFTLQHAYHLATGAALALDADHPLLQTRLMTDAFPSLEPLYEDEITQKLAAFGASAFGVEWKLRQAIVLKY